MNAATRMIWAESPTNPLLGINDPAQVARLSRARGAWSVADNSFATPYLTRPPRSWTRSSYSPRRSRWAMSTRRPATPLPALHSSIGAAARARNGITDGLVRLSVGIEDPADLVADIRHALAKVPQAVLAR